MHRATRQSVALSAGEWPLLQQSQRTFHGGGEAGRSCGLLGSGVWPAEHAGWGGDVAIQPTVRTQSPPFPLAASPDNVYNVPPGLVDNQVVADGYWVILPPLSVGAHELQFQGALCDPNTHVPFFEVQVTYHLTIVDNEDDE